MTITGKKYVECAVLESGNSVGAEAEDSSYDSDCEAEDPRSLFDSQLITAKHADVSRTASDTLATEFAEYVTVHGASSAYYTPGYAARVEFGLKLGYTERLVQTALQKLGPDPDQNELLAELIKLGASNVAPKLADTPDETEALLPDSEIHLASCHFIQERINSSDNPSYLRPVVVDGSNVAMSHGNKEVFSCRGIKICVDWFRTRGHREITVFVPKWRKEASRPDNPIADQDILGELERDRLLVFTPSRLVGGKRMVCYDDRYILRLAAELDGIVVSNDNYRDLAQESPEFRKVVEERILMYSFVNDRFMPPDDPLGRTGPTLDNFLRVGTRQTESTRPCPYAKKCTYGNKCKFRHPERGPHPQKSVSERLVEQAQRHQARNPLSMQLLKSISTPITQHQQPPQHSLLTKTKSWAPSDTSLTTSTSKSRSVENVTADSSVAHVQSCNKIASNQAYPSTFGWVAPKVVNMEMEPANMHRKLQRQLTLNPSCDARINQLRRFHDQQQQQQQTLTSQQPQLQSNCSSQDTRNKLHYASHTRQVTRQNSSDASYATSLSWDHQQQQHRKHQHVTRIASAPDTYQAWASRANNSKTDSSASAQQTTPVQRLGTSDSQLNVFEPQPVKLPMSNWGAQQQHQDARRHLHYHLANIFPEKQVQAAMALHPYETDPQQICAAILRMFPKL